MGFGDILKDSIGPLVGAGGAAASAALNAREAKKQRKWSRENYKHRFRWSMADMKAGGLNPILAAGMGLGGGGTPSGASASIGDMSGLGGQVTDAQLKSKQRSKIGSEQNLMTQLGAKHESDAAKARSDITVNEDTKDLIRAQAGAADAQRNRTNTNNLIEVYGLTDAMLRSKIAGKQSTEMARTAAEWGPVINALSGVAGAWGFGRFLSRSPNSSTVMPKLNRTFDPKWRPKNIFKDTKSGGRKGTPNIPRSNNQSTTWRPYKETYQQ